MKKIFALLALSISCIAFAGYPWQYQQQLTSTDLNAAFAARCTYSLGALPQYRLLLGNGNGDIAALGSFGTVGQVPISAGPGVSPAFGNIVPSIIVGSISTQVAATYTVSTTDASMIANYAGTLTYTLPSAVTYTGRMLTIRTITANTVVSASANVVPLAGGSAGTAILAGTAGKWADLQSDGTNWQIMRGN